MNKTQRNTQSNLPIKYGNFVQIFNQAEPILVQTTKRILLFHYLVCQLVRIWNIFFEFSTNQISLILFQIFVIFLAAVFLIIWLGIFWLGLGVWRGCRLVVSKPLREPAARCTANSGKCIKFYNNIFYKLIFNQFFS